MRLDVFVANLYQVSRQRAQDYIDEGYVCCNKVCISKASYQVKENDEIDLHLPKVEYVSRAGFKLQEALSDFHIDLQDKVVLDIGASTGGFTDCCLKNHAKHVYAVDVGTSQLHESLLHHSQVISMENTNAKSLSKSTFQENIDFICMDVSFISVKLLLPIIANLLDSGKEAVILIKPQFEVGKMYVGKNGIVKDKKAKKQCIQEIIQSANLLHFGVKNIKQCSTIGRDGNIEYLLHIVKDDSNTYMDLGKIIK